MRECRAAVVRGCDSNWRSIVAQVSKPAVSPTSKSAEPTHCVAAAGLETRDTADSEVCATVDHRFKSHPPDTPKLTPVPTPTILMPQMLEQTAQIISNDRDTDSYFRLT